MTDEELIKICAEKVMGWAWSVERTPYGEPMWFTDKDKTQTRGFNPLNDRDAFLVLDRMVELKYCYNLTFDDDGHHCSFDNQTSRRLQEDLIYADASEKTRARTIVMAAIKAVENKEASLSSEE